jgi:uncharacterized membrane protein YphA (DoxX/SURF4 family)
MKNQQKSSKTLNIFLWIAQVLLAAIFIWGAWMKIFTPVGKLSAMWPWVAHIPRALLKFTGIVDLLGGLGLILPALLRIKPKLTPIAALSIIILMICACIFHISRGEASVIGANIVFALMAAFIVWGRFKKAPIIAK